MQTYTFLALLAWLFINVLDTNAKLKVSNTLSSKDIAAIRFFSKHLSGKDTVITWWNYGWPLWYYSGYRNTLLDNGEHGGIDAYPVARLLLSTSDTFVANSALYFTKMHQLSQRMGEAHFTSHIAKSHYLPTQFSALEDALPKDANPEGNIYIILQQTMFDAIYTISQSADVNLSTGRPMRQRVVKHDWLYLPFSMNNKVTLGQSYFFDNRSGIVTYRDRDYPVRTLSVANEGKLIARKTYDHNASLHLIIHEELHAYYFDEETYRSFIVQAYLFDNYDKNRFEKIIETKTMKVFRVKKEKHLE